MRKHPSQYFKNIGTAILVCGFLFLFRCSENPLSPDTRSDVIQTIISRTNLDSLTLSVQELTGETTVIVNASSDVINSRYKDHPDNDLAADYIMEKLNRYGLAVVDERFSDTGRNIYGLQSGRRYPEQFYIICAHYDSYAVGEVAPGADDNASGTAAVLEAARLLSKYETDYSVIYALWDEEELGLVGSRYYAAHASAANRIILGVINLDMIGWDSDSDNVMMVGVNDIPKSIELSEQVFRTNDLYEIGLEMESWQIGRSDHVSFWENGFAAILIIEDSRTDFNDYYHSPEDRIEHFNLSYFHKCARLAIGTLAELAAPR